MIDTSQTLKPWLTFAGCVLVVVVLYWAQAILVPVALAILLTFVLTPAVTWLERWIGRAAAVLTVVALFFAVVALGGWGLSRQMNHLAEDLPAVPSQHPGKNCGAVASRARGDRSRSCNKPSKRSPKILGNRRRPKGRFRGPSS